MKPKNEEQEQNAFEALREVLEIPDDPGDQIQVYKKRLAAYQNWIANWVSEVSAKKNVTEIEAASEGFNKGKHLKEVLQKNLSIAVSRSDAFFSVNAIQTLVKCVGQYSVKMHIIRTKPRKKNG